MTLDGFCNHDAMIADDEMMEHYNELLRSADLMLFGRITYQLMESYWPSLVTKPSGHKPDDDFAALIDSIPKIVYSRTLHRVEWNNSLLQREITREDMLALKRQEGKNILAGSRTLINRLAQMDLIDEYQLNINPTILGSGVPLFDGISERIDLKLLNTKPFACGSVVHYYEPRRV